MVLDHQEASNELDDSVRVKVREALLKRHHHQNEKKKNLIPIVRSIAEGTRKQSETHLPGGIYAEPSIQTHTFMSKLNISCQTSLFVTTFFKNGNHPPGGPTCHSTVLDVHVVKRRQHNNDSLWKTVLSTMGKGHPSLT